MVFFRNVLEIHARISSRDPLGIAQLNFPWFFVKNSLRASSKKSLEIFFKKILWNSFLSFHETFLKGLFQKSFKRSVRNFSKACSVYSFMHSFENSSWFHPGILQWLLIWRFFVESSKKKKYSNNSLKYFFRSFVTVLFQDSYKNISRNSKNFFKKLLQKLFKEFLRGLLQQFHQVALNELFHGFPTWFSSEIYPRIHWGISSRFPLWLILEWVSKIPPEISQRNS